MKKKNGFFEVAMYDLCKVFFLMLWVALSIVKVFAQPTGLPPGFIAEEVFSGIESINMSFAPGNRIFVATKSGSVYLVNNGVLVTDPLITLNADASGERGLLGIAVDPEFEYNNYIYVYYTVPQINRNRLSRLTFHDGHIHSEEEKEIMLFDPLLAQIHNGGDLKFGPDGKLYISTGDGSQPLLSQSMSSLLGKIIRINPDGSIPTDNPFYFQNDGIYKSIYAYGFRNPFSMSFNEAGKLFSNDVGQGAYEEVNDVLPGKNYGWPNIEGELINNPNATEPENYQDPFYAYVHEGGACAIVGSTFSTSSSSGAFPEEYSNKYFFGDFCTWEIFMLDLETKEVSVFMNSFLAPVFLSTGQNGELYFMTFNYIVSGSLWRVFYSPDGLPRLSVQPKSSVHTLNETAEFKVSATGETPLSYQWIKNGEDVDGATQPTISLSNLILSDNGSEWTCRVTNPNGSILSEIATLTVSDRTRPEITFDVSNNSANYIGGDTIVVLGTAHNGLGDVIPLSNLQWRVGFNHDFHSHPVIGNTTNIDSIAFIAPKVGETSTNVWYRITLMATDDIGLTSTSQIDIYPNVASVTLKTVPNDDLVVSVDGSPKSAPHTFPAVAGMTRNLSTSATQYNDNNMYLFKNWSNNVTENSFNLDIPENNPTFIADFEEIFLGYGNGLTGNYYNQLYTFDGPKILQRVDSEIKFDWQEQSPSEGMNADNFSVEWTGFIRIPIDGEYSFEVAFNGGVRLWVNDILLIDQMNDLGSRELSAQLELEGNMLYPIRLQYSDKQDFANINLYWSSEMITKSIIPNFALYDKYYAPATAIGGLTNGFLLGSNNILQGVGIDHTGNFVEGLGFEWSAELIANGTTVAFDPLVGSQQFSFTLTDTLMYDPTVEVNVELRVIDKSGFISLVNKTYKPQLSSLSIQSQTKDVSVKLGGEGLVELPYSNKVFITGYRMPLIIADSIFLRNDYLFFHTNWNEGYAYDLIVTTDTVFNISFDSLKLDNGDGILAHYFGADKSFDSTPDSVKLETTVQFSSQSLVEGTKIKWAGWITPPIDGLYTLKAVTQEEVTIIIYDTIFQSNAGEVSKSSEINFLKGGYYPIEILYEATQATGAIDLFWSSLQIPNHMTPVNQLFTELPLTVGLESPTALENINVYPNPSTGRVILDWSYSDKRPELAIFNQQGLSVIQNITMSDMVMERKTLVDFNNMASGVYIIIVYGSDYSTALKVIIER